MLIEFLNIIISYWLYESHLYVIELHFWPYSDYWINIDMKFVNNYYNATNAYMVLMTIYRLLIIFFDYFRVK